MYNEETDIRHLSREELISIRNRMIIDHIKKERQARGFFKMFFDRQDLTNPEVQKVLNVHYIASRIEKHNSEFSQEELDSADIERDFKTVSKEEPEEIELWHYVDEEEEYSEQEEEWEDLDKESIREELRHIEELAQRNNLPDLIRDGEAAEDAYAPSNQSLYDRTIGRTLSRETNAQVEISSRIEYLSEKTGMNEQEFIDAARSGVFNDHYIEKQLTRKKIVPEKKPQKKPISSAEGYRMMQEGFLRRHSSKKKPRGVIKTKDVHYNAGLEIGASSRKSLEEAIAINAIIRQAQYERIREKANVARSR